MPNTKQTGDAFGRVTATTVNDCFQSNRKEFGLARQPLDIRGHPQNAPNVGLIDIAHAAHSPQCLNGLKHASSMLQFTSNIPAVGHGFPFDTPFHPHHGQDTFFCRRPGARRRLYPACMSTTAYPSNRRVSCNNSSSIHGDSPCASRYRPGQK